ncbi:VOC family protein [Nocardioides sp. zg-DK7169]|uniref:VOC family protein n=1 Tax=Nocardioides sp. zg-DK7169 TaxID=2736600 RepID=UPI0015523B31|nr:VOC family protein [Nocardioides sp. zg-DK7169]NPC96625.1 VOC family protein [Nocardioides sp. zg-DK7169]
MSEPVPGSLPTTVVISPCLWFDDGLEAAMDFYTSVFPGSSVGDVLRRPDPDGGTGQVLAADFTLGGVMFRGINGGPQFRFSEAVSFQIDCADQAETDHYWDRLGDGGEESMCGWLKDRFGVSWQVIPRRLYELLRDPDPTRAHAAQEAMLGMRRIVVADLEAAADAASRT